MRIASRIKVIGDIKDSNETSDENGLTLSQHFTINRNKQPRYNGLIAYPKSQVVAASVA